MIQVLMDEVRCPGLPSMTWYKSTTRIKYHWPVGKFFTIFNTSVCPTSSIAAWIPHRCSDKDRMGDRQPPTEEQRTPLWRRTHVWRNVHRYFARPPRLPMGGLWGTSCATLLRCHSCQLPALGHPDWPGECKSRGTGHSCGMKTSGHWVPGVRTQTRYWDKALESKWANHCLMKTKGYCFAAIFSFQKILELLCRPF